MSATRRMLERGLATAMKLARVAAYAFVVSVVLGLFALRSVYGAAKDSALEVGGELIKLGDVVGHASRVRLNGEPMNIASAMSDMSVPALLDRFEAECREHAGGLAEELARLPDAVMADMPPVMAGPAGIGIVRKEEGGRGMVACLARDDRGGGASVARGVADFLKSGDLSAIGKLRYVVAERAAGATRTHVVTAWTDGAFRLGAMFPREGDAPGSDARDMPRPLSSRRLLTASVEGAPYSVRIYDAASTPEAMLADYDRAMPARGWAAIPGVSREARNGRAFTREGVDVMVFTGVDGDRTIVSVVEMPPR